MLPKYIIFDIINNMREMGAYDIKFSGGEITLRDDLSEIIQHARKKIFKCCFIEQYVQIRSKCY